VWGDGEMGKWGGSAVLGRQRRHAGVSPMSNCIKNTIRKLLLPIGLLYLELKEES